ncbi:MAG: toll/interleukin-1 receptor domain-containing protein [Ilumatobacteraceae bacterium]
MATRRIGTIRIQVKRTIRVTTTTQQRIVTQRAPMPQRPMPLAAPAQLSRRSSVRYTQPEREFLGRVRDAVVADPRTHERDAFLCHAWADRQGPAAQLFQALRALDVDVWFSENEVQLGTGLARQLDAGLRVSKIGIVLVTPAMLASLRSRGFADQELGVLLTAGRAIPVLHDVTFDDLRNESPLLAARAGLSTAEATLDEVAAKIAEAVLGTS